MNDSIPELEAALHAQDALIAEAQRLLAEDLRPDGLRRGALITRLRGLFEGPRRRETQRRVREAFVEDPGNIA